jgi:hypothetical protein
MNTKSVVAAVKKPRATPKTVVKKPKATPKVAKAAKAVVKKPKATKAAKAVVKKPKAAKAVPKAAKVAKAAVKKSIRGGAGSRSSNGTKALIGGVFSASASAKRIGRAFSRFTGKTPSNAVAPMPTSVSPINIEKKGRLDFLKSMRPSPSVLLDIIKDTYISYMDNLITVEYITAYDLLVLIEIIAFNLNTFFEDFLYYYPTIKFKGDEYANDDNLLTYQSKFVRLIENIRRYIQNLRLGGLDIGIPYFRNKYLDPSTIVYSGILDGTQEGIEGYKRSTLNFFTNELIISLDELLEQHKEYSHYRRHYKQKGINIGDFFLLVGNRSIYLHNIMTDLNDILQQFFKHIQSIGINEGVGALDEKKKEYMRVVKDTAKENLRIISSYPYKFNIMIQKQEQEQEQDIERRTANTIFFAEN